MPAVAESGIGRPAIHQISKLAQRDVEHCQETEIISADQLAGAEVGFHSRARKREYELSAAFGIPSTPRSIPFHLLLSTQLANS